LNERVERGEGEGYRVDCSGSARARERERSGRAKVAEAEEREARGAAADGKVGKARDGKRAEGGYKRRRRREYTSDRYPGFY